ncbi:N-acetylneuraminate 9-O-acetyltransferase [Diorhabda sublineata]|uniref:N-acetylneuraminate 9-O-acetyltransferase n=1 Tax=Diorhabda sublineata TaxID=1163346 RepID=UPI0024E09155|nr:N-acetylneuraminate 9-O-acetyltransferase [Diorhabda sublineata]
MTVEKSRIEKIIDEINSTNAKKVALFLVLGFACYHGILHLKFGTNSCKWLLTDGRYKGDKEWQPYGCMLHQYTDSDTKRCLRYLAYIGLETHFVFIGDTRIGELYYAFVQHLNQKEDVSQKPQTLFMNYTHVDNRLKIKVDFIWSPFISRDIVDIFRQWDVSTHPPSVIVAGSALWPIMSSNRSESNIKEYQMNLTRLVQPIDNLSNRKIWILWALQAPVNEEKLKAHEKMITNRLIDLYNTAAIEVLSHSAADLWWSTCLVGKGMLQDSPDGIHLAERPRKHNTQILLNLYCNDNMNFNDGTCCSSVEPRTTLQIVTFAVMAMCVTTAIVMIIRRIILKNFGKPIYDYHSLPENDIQPLQPLTTHNYYFLFKNISKMSLIVAYFFICDRTNFFMKENKYYSEFSFWLPIGYITVLGLFFMEESKFNKVLHRDQLNEWKGWMQIVILVYHVTGASKVLMINMHIKVLISAYLFLLGYEQFCYVWYRNDVGIISFCRMLFQLNFVTVTLCLSMNRPYQFYYFAPLLSFWYLMIYCFVAFPPHITAQTSENNVIQYFYLLIKFITFCSVITILFMSEVFFEKIFVTRPWKALFVTIDDDIHEWWSRWKLDRYSTMYGMVFGVIMILSHRYNIFDDNNHSNLFSRGIALSSTLLALVGIGSYLMFTFLCRNELECSEIHSYIVFIPIVSFILLRNISGVLRTRYSSLFAWFGDISLELFISQYHIWLAADTHGVLVLVPGYPVLNLIITTYIFVCASHEVHSITKSLIPYAVPNDWKSALRNLILFLAVLVPIGINDGMF